MDTLTLLLTIARDATALLIIVDPLGSVPVFVTMEGSADAGRRRRALNLTMFVAMLILVLSATIGQGLLGLFNVGLPELMIAGGLLLTLIGMDLIFGFLPQHYHDSETMGIVPLACPLLAGPGAIVTTMLMIERHPTPHNYLIAFVSIVVTLGIAWGILYYSGFFIRLLGERGLLILGKLVGILVTAIGVHFVLQGLGDFWRLCTLGR
jgi:multiple antibiotic resistance protein